MAFILCELISDWLRCPTPPDLFNKILTRNEKCHVFSDNDAKLTSSFV